MNWRANSKEFEITGRKKNTFILRKVGIADWIHFRQLSYEKNLNSLTDGMKKEDRLPDGIANNSRTFQIFGHLENGITTKQFITCSWYK